MAVCFASSYDAWHCTWWCEACMQLLGNGNPFHDALATRFVLILMPVKVRHSSDMESAVLANHVAKLLPPSNNATYSWPWIGISNKNDPFLSTNVCKYWLHGYVLDFIHLCQWVWLKHVSQYFCPYSVHVTCADFREVVKNHVIELGKFIIYRNLHTLGLFCYTINSSEVL